VSTVVIVALREVMTAGLMEAADVRLHPVSLGGFLRCGRALNGYVSNQAGQTIGRAVRRTRPQFTRPFGTAGSAEGDGPEGPEMAQSRRVADEILT
jgi:hypothetical protein